jgi:Raf kinase inhibitor-like YbhB/YbcL family protein
MRRGLGLATMAAVVLAASAAVAQPASAPNPPATAPAPPAPIGLALAAFPAAGGRTLAVTSPAFRNGGDIPFRNTQYEGNVFPGLTWTRGPRGMRSFVVIMQDADARPRSGGVLLHWSMYDIAAGTVRLGPGLTAPPAGANFGPSYAGPSHAYLGPRTPRGPKHHYHFAVLALDEVIPPDPGLTWAALAADISGHVLASGEVVGLGQFDPDVAATPPPPPR